MTNKEHDISRLAGLDSYGGQYSKSSALNAERARLEAEIAHLNYLLEAHGECCDALQVCTLHAPWAASEQPVSEASSR
jgi:hypothetical protein